MKRFGGIRIIVGTVGIALLLTGCATVSTGVAATDTAVPQPSATSSPKTTETAVNWQDAEALVILPSATTPDHLPHGPSWSTEDGHLRCGVYDDRQGHDANGNPTALTVFYGCRIDQTASTFTYPDFDSPGKGLVGGCPSGFSANAGEIPAPLCNSGQVFASETDDTNVLKVGEGVRFAGIECVATAEDAMSCTEPATGHGFRASLSDYALF